ncbi:MAG: ATP-binding protein [Anaerolineae bacterium]
MTACVLALTTADGMLGSMMAEHMQDVTRFTGRVLLQSPGAGYPPFNSVLSEEFVTTTLDRPDVAADESTPLLFLVLEPPHNPMDDAGIMGLGLLPGRERVWLNLAQISSGRVTLAGEDDDVVILGSRAARFYDVPAIGETITIARRRWRVSGLLEETGNDMLDNLVVMPLASAQAAFGLEGWLSAVLLTAKEGRGDDLARSLAVEHPTLGVKAQEDIHRLLLQKMELPTRFLGMISWAAFVIAGLIVANITSIAVRERTQAVESIRAIGEGRPAILSYTVVEALLLSLSGGVLGALAAVPTAYLLDWTYILSWGEMARVLGLVLAAGLLAGVYPAYRAAHAYPQALRYDELRRQMEEVAAEKRAMDQAYRHLVRGREAERESLARELHDQAIQSLVGLKFRLVETAPEAQAELQPEIDRMIEALRELCAGLRPPALEWLGLVAALRSHVDDFGARTGLPVELHLDGDERRLTPEAELSLFRVAQEALANAWKHAQTPKVEVSLLFGETAVEITICDRGRGFEAPERLRALAEAGHFGLVGMRERMELVGGRLRLTSEPGRGTTITAQAPLSTPG